jgi:hypothetical protein
MDYCAKIGKQMKGVRIKKKGLQSAPFSFVNLKI